MQKAKEKECLYRLNKFKLLLVIGVVCACVSGCKTPEIPIGESIVARSAEAKKLAAAKINIRLGIAYLQRQDISRSKQKFLLALEEAPNLPESWYAMAYFLEQTKNNEQANLYYKKAIALAPSRGDTLNNYGTFLCRVGKYREAVNYFLRATLDPKYLDPSAAYENAGLCAAKMPNKVLAMQYFKRALDEDPTRTTSLLELAKLNYQSKNYEAAEGHLNQYLKLAIPTEETTSLQKDLKERAVG